MGPLGWALLRSKSWLRISLRSTLPPGGGAGVPSRPAAPFWPACPAGAAVAVGGLVEDAVCACERHPLRGRMKKARVRSRSFMVASRTEREREGGANIISKFAL